MSKMSSWLSRKIFLFYYCTLTLSFVSFLVASQNVNIDSAGIVEVRINNRERSYQLIVPPDGTLAYKDLLSDGKEAPDIRNVQIYSDTNARCFFWRKDGSEITENTASEDYFVSNSFSTEDSPSKLEDDGTYLLSYTHAERLYCYDTSNDNVEMNDTFTVFLENDVGSAIFRLRLKPNAFYTIVSTRELNLTVKLKKFALIHHPKPRSRDSSSPFCYVLWDHNKLDSRIRPKEKMLSTLEPIAFKRPISLDGIICFRDTNDPETVLKIMELMGMGSRNE